MVLTLLIIRSTNRTQLTPSTTMAIIKSGATSDELTIDPVSKASRVTEYDTTGRSVSRQSKSTFFASGTFTPPATPTDLVTIFGSASKTVRVLSMVITTTNTAAGSQQFFLVKRSTTNTGGTFIAATPVQADTTDDAATAVVGHYTVNPTALGITDGNINIRRVASPVAIPASFAGIVRDAGIDLMECGTSGASASGLHKPITLNAGSQGLCINFNGAALVLGQTHAYQIVWTEE